MKTLKGQLEQKKMRPKRDESCSPEGEVLENSTDADVMDMQSMRHTRTNTVVIVLVGKDGSIGSITKNGYVYDLKVTWLCF